MEVLIFLTLLIGILILKAILNYKRSQKGYYYNRSVKKSKAAYTDNIFYHEDDYRQVELLPFENLNELLKRAENISDFGEEHFNGAGFTDIIMREESRLPLKERKIVPDALDEVLAKLRLKRYGKVSTGIRPGEIICTRTVGYGQNYNGIFFEVKDEVINAIWISGSLIVDKTLQLDVLYEIGCQWNLVLMDWNSCELINLKDKRHIEKYLG